jgi:hypothetical protein
MRGRVFMRDYHMRGFYSLYTVLFGKNDKANKRPQCD